MPIILNGTTGITTPGITNTGPFTFQGVVELPAGAVGAPSLTTTGDTNTGIYFPAANQVAIATDGAQRVLVDATGNFGIGTSSPARKLIVADTNAAMGLVSANTGYSELYFSDAAGSPGALSYNHNNDTLNFYTNSNNRATIDSSGNLGLGVTPSAWQTTGNQRAIQISNVGSISSLSNAIGNQQLNLARNVYDFYAAKYITSDSASAFRLLGDNSFGWFTAPSGTAGNAITFTQAMTLDANSKLTVGGDIAASQPGTGNVGLSIARIGGTAVDWYLYAPSGSQDLVFFRSGERARFTAAGGFALGTTVDPGAGNIMLAGLSNAIYGNATTGSRSYIEMYNTSTGDMTLGVTFSTAAIRFATGASNTERARITSGGNLLVGTTSDATVNATSARTNVNGNLNVTGYTQTSLFQTGLGVPDTGDPSGWCRLGRIDTSQGGAVVHIRVYFHTGFNASVAQTGMADILFKTSNGSSSTAGSTGPFYGDVVTYSYGYAGIGIIRVVQNNTSQYDFFLFLGSYTNGSIYTVDVTSPTTWTQFGNLQTPSGNYIDSGIRNVAYS